MDNNKLNEAELTKRIKTLVLQERYEDAQKALQEIDLGKIKNVSILCLAGEVYMGLKQYDDAEHILLRVYEKQPNTRRILDLMTTLYIDKGEYSEAEYYYKEFIGVASKDLHRYILRYRLDKGKGERLSVLIDTLEKLKDYEYIEEWAYELARLYDEVGEKKKCIHECDEIVLWFGHGEYVDKAIALKCKLTGQPLPEVTTVEQHKAEEERLAEKAEEEKKAAENAAAEAAAAIEKHEHEYLNPTYEDSIDVDLIERAIEGKGAVDPVDTNVAANGEKEAIHPGESSAHADAAETSDAADGDKSQKSEAEAAEAVLALLDEISTTETAATQNAAATSEEATTEVTTETTTEAAAETSEKDTDVPKTDEKSSIAQLFGSFGFGKLKEKVRMKAEEVAAHSPLTAAAGNAAESITDALEKAVVQKEAEDLAEHAAVQAEDDTLFQSDAESQADDVLQDEADVVQQTVDTSTELATETEIESDAEIESETETETETESESEIEIEIEMASETKSQTVLSETDAAIADAARAITDFDDDDEDEIITVDNRRLEDLLFGAADTNEVTGADEVINESDDDEDDEDDEVIDESDDDEDEVISDTSVVESDDFMSVLFGEADSSVQLIDDDGEDDDEDEIITDEDKEKDEIITDEDDDDDEIITDDDDDDDDDEISDNVQASDTVLDIFATVAGVKSIQNQLAKTFTKFEDPALDGMDLLAPYDINFIVTGDDMSVKSQISIGIAKALNTYGICDKNKLVRATPENLNGMDFRSIFEKLKGGCLIIENAELLNDAAVAIIAEYVQKDGQEVAIVLEGLEDDIKVLFKKYPILHSKFLNIIHIGKYNENELVELAKSYAEKKKYTMSGDAAATLKHVLRERMRDGHSVNYEDIMAIVEEAIASLEKRNMRNLFMTVLDNKYEEAAMFELQSADFDNINISD